jgi:hypothetical protein
MERPPRAETWISLDVWEALLNESKAMWAGAELLRISGMDTDHIWKALRPINQTIRSPLLKVHGIDDRFPTHQPSVSPHPRGTP